MKRKRNVLFFSTGDATRSRMAAALLRQVTDELDTACTAVKSTASDGLAGEVLGEIGVDISKHAAKPVKQHFQETFTVVVTLSDDTKERSPIWPFTRNLVHWNMPDPATAEGPAEKKREVFRRTRDDLRKRTMELVSKVNPALKSKAHAA
jgi:arsenate reductase (thioredoxin)